MRTSQTGRMSPALGGAAVGNSPWDLNRLSGLQRSSRLAFVFIMVAALTVSIMAVIDAGSLVGHPFPGFFVNERLVASNFGRPGWTGPQGGIRYPDKLIKADGMALNSADDLRKVVEKNLLERSIVYVIEREGRDIEVSIQTMWFAWWDLAATFGPTFVAGLLYLIIAAVVYALKPDTAVTWAFVTGCFLIGIYQIVTFDVATTHRFVKSALFIYAFIPAAGLHLSLLFPERKSLARWRSLQLLPYVVSAALAASAYWHYHGVGFSSVYALMRMYSGLSVAAILLSVVYGYFQSPSRLARQRAKVVLTGAAFAFPIPGIVNNLSLLGSTPGTVQVLGTFVPFPLLLFPASISFAIVRHNLFDVDVYLKRAVGYVLMTALVAGGYFLLQALVKTTVLDPMLGPASEQVYALLFALLTVFAFNPLSRTVQQGVDKLFYRKGYDYKATVTAVSEALSSFVNVQSFISGVVQRIRQDMFVDRAGVVVLDPRQQTCDSVFLEDQGPAEPSSLPTKAPCLSLEDPLLALLERERRIITKYDIAEDPLYGEVRDACGQRFSELGVSLALPLFYRDEFAGMMALGYKKSGHFYTREDVELLQTISAMTSTAIEHSREKGQRAVLMQLFSKHVSPQVAETLWEQREQFLEGGRPRAQALTVTAMFTDLQGFSTMSEKQDPEVLMKWLNTYMEMVTTTVMEHGGVVDDFFGDGVKINFGVPIPRTTESDIGQDAVNAVTCALAMEAKMGALNVSMATEGFQPLRMRIGIYTGPVVAGSLGSADRMKYTTLGDTVNTAARLESFSKELNLPHLESCPCRILIGESTRHYLGEQFELQRVGDMELKGKVTKITTFCVLGRRAGDSNGGLTGRGSLPQTRPSKLEGTATQSAG